MTAGTWKPKYKNYPHFDLPLSTPEIYALVQSPSAVIENAFLPFLTYSVVTKKFGTHKAKTRDIRYGARKDAYIYSYYRHQLLRPYEAELSKAVLSDHVIAYRKLSYLSGGVWRGKSNINFAMEAFDEVKRRRNCVAITLDISKFFENLDHAEIKEKWKRVLGVSKLPKDHYNIFKSVTSYSFVSVDDCMKRLDYLKVVKRKGKLRKVYRLERKAMPKQLCGMEEFREKIVGSPGYDSLIFRNPYLYPDVWLSEGKALADFEPKRRGIPQGTPISDLIANFYMLDFDRAMAELAQSTGGYYRRYSDDILFISDDVRKWQSFIETIKSLLESSAKGIALNDDKTLVTKFAVKLGRPHCQSFDGAGKPKGHALEYLGFSFDGIRKLIRSQTISRYYKKARIGIRAHVIEAKKKAIAGKFTDCTKHINKSLLFHQYSRVNINWPTKTGKKPSNFQSYVRRAASLSGGADITNQFKRHRQKLSRIIKSETKRANKSLV